MFATVDLASVPCKDGAYIEIVFSGGVPKLQIECAAADECLATPA